MGFSKHMMEELNLLIPSSITDPVTRDLLRRLLYRLDQVEGENRLLRNNVAEVIAWLHGESKIIKEGKDILKVKFIMVSKDTLQIERVQL